MSPRGLMLVGSHLCAGVLFVGPRARTRVLDAWRPGATVHALAGDRLLLLFDAPIRMRSELVLGALVVRTGSALTTAPIEVGDDTESDVLIVYEHGRRVPHAIGPKTRVEPSDWIDRSGLRVVEAAPLGVEPKVVMATKIASTAAQAIGGMPERAPDAPRFEDLAHHGASGPRSMPPSGPGLLARLFSWFRSRFGRTVAASPSADTGLARRERRAATLWERLRGWVGQWLLRTQLARVVARQHAAYLERMLSLFDQGDVREALKWAIPLGGDEPAGPLALTPPTPRGSLAITLARGPTSSIPGPPGLYELLRSKYLAILVQLQQDGAIDEAAFLLAEILRDPAGAVALLERHERYEQAARLAEAADLEPAVQMRTWILAKNTARAIRIARRHPDHVAIAIAMLSRAKSPAADALALAWANALADAGSFVDAVHVVRAIASAEPLMRAWVERALDIGGAAGAQMLVRRAILSPDRWEDTRRRAVALLDDDDAEGTRTRDALAAALLAETPTPATRVLARAAVRASTRDRRGTDIALGTRDDALGRLRQHSSDGALRVDVPAHRHGVGDVPLAAASSPMHVRIDARDVGAIAIHDIAYLPSGRVVVALGEAGVRVLSRDGRVVRSFRAPAHALVVSDTGTRALAVARRGVVSQVTRLDLVVARSEPWWEAPLDDFARSFDGSTWLVAENSRAHLMDVLDTSWSALATIDHWVCTHVARSVVPRELLVAGVAEGAAYCAGRYDGDLHRLKRRHELQRLPAAIALCGTAWGIFRDAETESHALTALVDTSSDLSAPIHGKPVSSPLSCASFGISVASAFGIGVRVDLLSLNAKPLLHVLLDGASTAIARCEATTLSIADDRGRALVFDAATGRRIRDLRIRP